MLNHLAKIPIHPTRLTCKPHPSVMPVTSIGCYAPLWRHKSHRPSHIFTYSSPRKECSVKHHKFNWLYCRLCCFWVVFNRVTQLQVDMRAILRLNQCIAKTPRRHHLCKVILCLAVKRSLVACATKRTKRFMMYTNMNSKSVLSLVLTWKTCCTAYDEFGN